MTTAKGPIVGAVITGIATVFAAVIQVAGFFINNRESKPTTILNNFNSGFQGVMNTFSNSPPTIPQYGASRSSDSPSGGSSQEIKLSDGLVATISSAGRSKNGRHVSIAMTLTNKGKNTLFLTLAGPTSAQDNNGGLYGAVDTSSGISLCPSRSSANNCISSPGALVGMTKMEPGNQANLAFSLTGNESKGPLISFSTVLVGRAVSDLEKDSLLTDEEKKKQLVSFNLGFPPVKLVEAQ